MRKIIIPALLVVAVSACIFLFKDGIPNFGAKKEEETLSVKAQMQDLSDTVKATGTLQPSDETMIQVYGGLKISKVYLDFCQKTPSITMGGDEWLF